MTTTDPIPDKLNITQDDVVRVIRRMIKVDGLEAARRAFRQMNEFFTACRAGPTRLMPCTISLPRRAVRNIRSCTPSDWRSSGLLLPTLSCSTIMNLRALARSTS